MFDNDKKNMFSYHCKMNVEHGEITTKYDYGPLDDKVTIEPSCDASTEAVITKLIRCYDVEKLIAETKLCQREGFVLEAE